MSINLHLQRDESLGHLLCFWPHLRIADASVTVALAELTDICVRFIKADKKLRDSKLRMIYSTEGITAVKCSCVSMHFCIYVCECVRVCARVYVYVCEVFF